MFFVEVSKYVGINWKWDSNRRCDQLQRLRCASTAMNAKHNTSGVINRVTKGLVVDLSVLKKPSLFHQGTLKCIDEHGRRSIVAVDNTILEVAASLAVGNDLCLILPTILVLRRRDSADGAVDNITSGAKLNIRHDGFYHSFQSNDNLRIPCKVADETTTMDRRVRDEGDIEW